MPWKDVATHLAHLKPAERDRVRAAYALGERIHAGQTRKSGEPFFTHPEAVASLLADIGADADTLIAALLHDAFEDTSLTAPEVETQFGQTVVRLIEGVTKLTADEVAERPTLDLQIETLRKMFRLMEQDVRIMLIKLYDRLHNMRTIRALNPDRQQVIAQETLDVYAKIADRLSMRNLRYELEIISLEILQPEEAAALLQLRERQEKRGRKLMKAIREYLDPHLPADLHLLDFQYEHQAIDKLQALLRAEGSSVTGVADISVIFLCPNEDACYRMLGVLHRLWRREILSFQDYVNIPLINGYRGIHTTLLLADGTRVRCKMQTPEMHAYSENGIALYCFDSQARGIQYFLPWTERITSVAEDTRGQSNDFWDSLQSDILGELITVHGTGDRMALVPRNSTALDAAIYLYNGDALRLTAIRVNGKDAPFHTPLKQADTVEVSLAKSHTATRDWLETVHTAYATASIRSFLASRSRARRVHTGRDILATTLRERGFGFLEEISVQSLEKVTAALGLDTTHDLFTEIAEGRIKTDTVIDHLFTGRRRLVTRRQTSAIRFQLEDHAALQQMPLDPELFHAQYLGPLQESRIRPARGGAVNVTLRTMLDDADLQRLKRDLQQLGAVNLEVITLSNRLALLIAVVIVLWALNPVLAKWILEAGMQPHALITLRLFTVGFLNVAFFLLWRSINRARYSAIHHLAKEALLPAAGLIGMTVFNYLALLYLPPSVHLTILRFNTLLLPALAWTYGGKMSVPSRLFAGFIILATSAFTLSLGVPVVPGLLFSLGALFSYTLYTLTMEHALQRKKIDLRHPYFLLHMGLWLLAAGLLSLPFTPAANLLNDLTLPAILYIAGCVAIPHILYSSVLKTTRFKYFSDFQLAEIPLAILFELIVLGLFQPPLGYLSITLVVILLIYARRKALLIPMKIASPDL